MRPLLPLLLLLGCSSASADPPTATPDDTGTAEVAVDSAPPLDTATDTAACDIGTAVPSSAVSASIVFVEGDVVVPTATGGDATGDWAITTLTLYLSPDAKSQIDTSKSSITGTGWASFTATDYRVETDMQIKLETTLVGTVNRGIENKSKGTFTVATTDLKFTAACVDSSSGTPIDHVGWSRVDDTHALMFIPTAAGPGSSYTKGMVAELARVK